MPNDTTYTLSHTFTCLISFIHVLRCLFMYTIRSGACRYSITYCARINHYWLYVTDKNCTATVSVYIHLPRMLLSMGYLNEKTDLTSYLGAPLWDFHTILRIISRGFPGLATDSPCGVWDWMNHLPPVWWSTFRLRFVIVSRYESFIGWRGIFL